jgi:hypothetical protein
VVLPRRHSASHVALTSRTRSSLIESFFVSSTLVRPVALSTSSVMPNHLRFVNGGFVGNRRVA